MLKALLLATLAGTSLGATRMNEVMHRDKHHCLSSPPPLAFASTLFFPFLVFFLLAFAPTMFSPPLRLLFAQYIHQDVPEHVVSPLPHHYIDAVDLPGEYDWGNVKGVNWSTSV